MIAAITILVILLFVYAAGLYGAAWVAMFARRPAPPGPPSPDPIVVLVPARHEGDRALRVVSSLVAQDHPGPVQIHLLLADSSDNAMPMLAAHWGVSEESPTVTLAPRRTLTVVFAGKDGKSDKVNAAVATLDTPWVAILDCDHQAHPSWLSTSLAIRRAGTARLVQARRGPLLARGLFPLWDSLHQHVGCELWNGAFTELGTTVFFTGTTALMDTALLRDYPPSRCITEDVDLSYRMLIDGQRSAYNPHSGSDEECSPDLYSFLARRRRWANGHTETFFRHLRRGLTAPMPWKERLQFLFHGSHYVISVAVFVLHLLIGAWFLPALPPTSTTLAAALSLGIAASLARTQKTLGFLTQFAELFVLFFWWFPAVVIATNFSQAILVHDLGRAALPLHWAVAAMGLLGLFAPPLILILGLLRFRQLGGPTLLAVVVSWPVAFYLDLSGVLLGITDLVVGRARWRAVSRAPSPPSSEDAALLRPALGLKESWNLHGGLLAVPWALLDGARGAWWRIGLVVLGFGVTVLYASVEPIQLAKRSCQAMAHDGDPWIVPANRVPGYCDPEGAEGVTHRTGRYETLREDTLHPVDPTHWDVLDDTFFCNLAAFSPGNVQAREEGVVLRIDAAPGGAKAYRSGSIATRKLPSSDQRYGRYEAELRPVRASGVITAMFLYRFDPWQEIDMEVLGKDTTKVLLNVFYNPGEAGDLYNYGYRGTPVLMDVGFDLADSFHRYTIEWEADEIRFFIDDTLIHVRAAGRPTPIPHLPMRFHLNAWPCCSEELAGAFTGADLPLEAGLRRVRIASWEPSPLDGLRTLGIQLVRKAKGPADWRQNAPWLQPKPSSQ